MEGGEEARVNDFSGTNVDAGTMLTAGEGTCYYSEVGGVCEIFWFAFCGRGGRGLGKRVFCVKGGSRDGLRGRSGKAIDGHFGVGVCGVRVVG